VAVLHGALDDVVPVGVSHELLRRLPAAAGARLHVVPDGDHRLSRPQDLQLLREAVVRVLGGES
jgi:fermentation-respiration switch protein FrsA (DUF1100 family)